MLRKRNNFIVILVAFTVIKIGISFPLKKVSNEIVEMSANYDKLKNEVTVLSQFEDSVIYGNSTYKKKILESVSTISDIKELRAKNQQELEDKIGEMELLSTTVKQVWNKYQIYDGIDTLANVLIVVGLVLIGIVMSRRT